MTVFKGKEIVLGVTGCIAAYKSAELVRQIVKKGGIVHVIMTESACEFISPLTFQTLTGNPVATDMFQLYDEKEIGHISLAGRADVLAIAPATANIIGKIAGGIADDMLSTVIMATRAPVFIAPAMNENMWKNPVLQKNIEQLKSLQYHFIDPGYGDLACGTEGMGRLPDVEDIVEEMTAILSKKDFYGWNVIVTAGPTQEALDPVRFLTNPSSGKMGFSIARALRRRGATVTLISGPTTLSPPRGVNLVPVVSAADMAVAMEVSLDAADAVIKAAAVADYRPKHTADQKMKKSEDRLIVELEKTTDILFELGKNKGDKILVGFAAETQDVLIHGKEKLAKKNLDMIVVNDVSRKDIGFGSDENQATIVFSDGTTEQIPSMTKDDLAHCILDGILQIKNNTTKRVS